jgi:uncharacterized protein (DUF433 family)
MFPREYDGRNSSSRRRAGGERSRNPRGKPVFRGTRLPIETLFEYLADGLTLGYYLETFPSITREQVLAVLRYGQKRIELELAA